MQISNFGPTPGNIFYNPPAQDISSTRRLFNSVVDAMHLMYDEDPVTGKRIYTLKKVLDGTVTKSAHPARFSPDDKYSR